MRAWGAGGRPRSRSMWRSSTWRERSERGLKLVGLLEALPASDPGVDWWLTLDGGEAGGASCELRPECPPSRSRRRLLPNSLDEDGLMDGLRRVALLSHGIGLKNDGRLRPLARDEARDDEGRVVDDGAGLLLCTGVLCAGMCCTSPPDETDERCPARNLASSSRRSPTSRAGSGSACCACFAGKRCCGSTSRAAVLARALAAVDADGCCDDGVTRPCSHGVSAASLRSTGALQLHGMLSPDEIRSAAVGTSSSAEWPWLAERNSAMDGPSAGVSSSSSESELRTCRNSESHRSESELLSPASPSDSAVAGPYSALKTSAAAGGSMPIGATGNAAAGGGRNTAGA